MPQVLAKGNAKDDAAIQQRLALTTSSGPAALMRNLRLFFIASFACLGGLLYGYNQGVFSGVLTMTAFGNHMGDYVTNSTKKGWLTSILELGAYCGTWYSGFLSEIISRKYAIVVNTVIFIIGVVVQLTATAGGYQSILGGRFVTGMGVGSLSMIVPMYVAECSPPEVRGLLVALQQFSIEFGIMVSFWIDYGTNFIGGTGETQSDAAWLVPLALQLAPALVLLVGMIFMPFSPRWLVHHNREQEARRTLALLRKTSVDDERLELEFLEIKSQSLFEKQITARKFPSLAEMTPMNAVKLQMFSTISLFKTLPMFRRVIVAVMIMFFQQWTGINAILYYAPSIFKNLGQDSNTTSLLATGVVGIVMLVATVPAMLFIDRIGRKPILTAGAVAMGVCHMIIAVIFARNANQWPTHQAAGWAAVAMVWVFVANFGCEVWPLSARPYGIALGASSNWMNNFIVGQVTPDMIEHLTYGTFIFFGLFIFLGALFIWLFCPETKQLTLEEMDAVFGSIGVVAADWQLIEEINKEIGLKQRINKRET